MRIGIFGGSFDPPHNGHLLVAQDAIDVLRLHRLLIVPAATQPLKGAHPTAAVHRLAMAEHCFDGVPATTVDRVEIDRGGLSFMVDTVDHVQARWPGALIQLLVGEDVVPTFPAWKDAERLLSMVTPVVLFRPGLPGPSTAGGAVDAAGQQRPNAIASAMALARRLATRRVDVSSTEIRARVREGRSIKGFVPDAVAEYIASTALYQGGSAGAE